MDSFSHKQIARNFVSLFLGQYGGMACNMIFSIMLTRMLVPQDFGLLAMLLFYFIFFNWIVEWGWEQGFMAHREIPLEQAASTHFWIRFCLGVIPFITFLGCYYGTNFSFIHDHFHLVMALCGVYWCEKIGLTYRTILERSYKLDTLAGLEFFNVILSYALACFAACHGWGVWSLVLQRFIDKGFISFAYFWASPWKYGFTFDYSVARTFFTSFGLATWLGGIVSLTIYEFMPFLVGKLCSTYEAGLYAKAFSMATFPVMLTGIFNRLTTPLYAQHQFNVLEIKSIFVRAQTVKMLSLIPLQLGMAITAHSWIPWLIGDKWIPMVEVYQVMTIYGILRAFFDDVPGVFLYGFKNPWELTKSQLLQSVVVLSCAPMLVMTFKAWGGALAMGCMLGIAVFFFWRKIFKQLSCSWRDFWVCIIDLPSSARRVGSLFFSD